MKRLKTIINIIIWTLVAIYIAVITLTNIPAVQTFIGKEIAGVIAAKLHTNVSISRVDVGFLNRIIIDGVRIDDLRGKKMFQATRLAAKISLTDLANGRVAVSSAQVFGMDTYLYRDSAGQPLNIQFVLDALASKDTTSHKPLDIEIGSLVVRHGKLRYDQLDSHDYKLTSLRHLSLGDISAHIVVNKLTDDSLNINIKKLAFKESSGLRLDDFKMKLAANRSAAHVDKLQLIMPGTNIQTDELSATYSFDKGRLMLPSLQYRLAISNTIISPSDFSPLLQQLSSLDRKLQLKTRLYGTSTSMSLENFSLSTTDGDARMSLTGALTKGFRNPAWHIVLEQLTATSSILSDIAASISSDDKTRQLAAKVGTLSISGTAGGAKRQMSLSGKVSSDIGDANLRAGLNGDNMSFELDMEDINLIIKQTVSDIYSRYLRTRSRGKAELSSTLMDKYLAELREAETIVTEEIQRVYFIFRRRRDIAKIEFPALELIINRELVSRKIPYLFKTQKDENILTVQIVSEYFFDIPITMENVDKATRLMRYFLNRPDCAREEMPEIRRRRDYRLAKSWKEVASSGSL